MMRPTDMVLALTTMLIWGFNFVVAKVGLAQLPPLFFMGLRFAIVAAVLAPFVRLPPVKLRAVAWLSLSLGLGHFSLMYIGLQGLDAGTAAVVVQTQVPFAAILAAVIFSDYLGWRRTLGMAIAFLGIVCIAGEPRIWANPGPLLLVLGASALWAVANIQIKLMSPIDGLGLSGHLGLFSAPQLLLASAVFEDGQLEALKTASWQTWGALFYVSLMVTIVSFVLWYRLLHRYQVNQVMPYTLLVPVLGVIAGVIVLDEPLSWQMIVGGLLTVVGVGIIVLRRPKLAEPIATAKTT